MKRIEACFTYIKMLSNDGHYEFYDLIYANLKNRIQSIYMLSPLWNSFETAFIKEENVFRYKLHSHQTKEINMANKGRIHELQALRRDIKYFRTNEDRNISQAAETIYTNVLHKYGRIENGSSSKATASIKNIIWELTQNVELIAHIQRLNLQMRISKLEQQNKVFEQCYIARQIERNKKAERGTMRNLRPNTDKTFKAITDAVNTLYHINEIGAKDSELRYKLDEVIDYINVSVKQIEVKLSRTGRIVLKVSEA